MFHVGSGSLLCFIFLKDWISIFAFSLTSTNVIPTSQFSDETGITSTSMDLTLNGQLMTTSVQTTKPVFSTVDGQSTTNGQLMTTSVQTTKPVFSTEDGQLTTTSVQTTKPVYSTVDDQSVSTEANNYITSKNTHTETVAKDLETMSSLSVSAETTPISSECQCEKVTACNPPIVSQEEFYTVVAVLCVLLFLSIITILILLCFLRRQRLSKLKDGEGTPVSGGKAESESRSGENLYMDLQKDDDTESTYKSLNTNMYQNVNL